jgi:tRNA splicing endonuclease
MIEGKIIEQVTEFNYMQNKISDYKKDMQYKSQTYNTINGIIKKKKHFVNKYLIKKLRIHNITVKAALRYGSERRVLNERDKQRLEAAQGNFVRILLVHTKSDCQRRVDTRE